MYFFLLQFNGTIILNPKLTNIFVNNLIYVINLILNHFLPSYYYLKNFFFQIKKN